MQYLNGRVSKMGDRIVAWTDKGVPFVAMVGACETDEPGVVWVFPLPSNDQKAKLSECLHIDDAMFPKPAPVCECRRQRHKRR